MADIQNLTRGTAPGSVSQFDCVAVNVIGPTTGGPALGTSSCTYAGITSTPISLSDAGSAGVSLSVPNGSAWTIEVLGFYDPSGFYCHAGKPVGVVAPFNTAGNQIYELGRVTINLFADQTVLIPDTYDSLNPSQQLASEVSCSTPVTVPFTLSPATGAVGTVISLAGADFSSLQSVSIGKISALILSHSSSSAKIFVMPGTSSGAITATVSSGTLSSADAFMVTATGVPSQPQGAKLVGSGVLGTVADQGFSVALSADGNTAAVGGYNDDSGKGAVWIFTRGDGVWTQQAKLVGSGAQENIGPANQGDTVALSADGNTLIEGGANDNHYAGAAWIFTRNAGVWTQQGDKLIGSGAVNDGTSWVFQGGGVAISADGNTAAISGPNDNTNEGAAWVFTRTAGVWTQQGDKLHGSGASGAANQGTTVALSSDGNTLLSGGTSDAGGVGAAWAFSRTGSTWTQIGTKLVASDSSGPYIGQGGSVSLSSDGRTALIGGSGDNSNVGAAWVFVKTPTTVSGWIEQAKLGGTQTDSASYLGSSVALSADGNTALVGGSGDGGNTGATWVFTRIGKTWSQPGSKLVGATSTGPANQGNSVALSSDGNTALIGGSGDNSGAGAVWSFTPSPLAR